MKTLGNTMMIVGMAAFVSLAAGAQELAPSPPSDQAVPPPSDQAAVLPWDCPNQGLLPGPGPCWGPGLRGGRGPGGMMGLAARGGGAGQGQGWCGPMACGKRAFAGGWCGAGMQAQRGNRPGRGAALGRGNGGRGVGRQQMAGAKRGMRSGRGRQFGPGAQLGRGGGAGMGCGWGMSGAGPDGQGMRQFAGPGQGRRFADSGQGRQFAAPPNASQGRVGSQRAMRGGRGAGRGLSPVRQQRRDGSCLDFGSDQVRETMKLRIEHLRAQLDQLERALEADQP